MKSSMSAFTEIPTATSAAFATLRVSALLADELDRALSERLEIGLSEVLVLVQLLLAGGQARMADLADLVVVSRAGVTKIVDRLVVSGLVERVPSEEDRRVVRAMVTEAGKSVVRDARPVVDEVTARRLGDILKTQDLTRLDRMMEALSCQNPGWEPPDVV